MVSPLCFFPGSRLPPSFSPLQAGEGTEGGRNLRLLARRCTFTLSLVIVGAKSPATTARRFLRCPSRSIGTVVGALESPAAARGVTRPNSKLEIGRAVD